jgi:beta-fructofuranosidase
MCYQALPDRTMWSPECAWGHAVSPDLVVWEERDLVLRPGSDELGCWSGSVVVDERGDLRAFYTRVVIDDPDVSQIAVARCEAPGRFTSSPDDVVIAAPPVGVRVFRDPYVWCDEHGWTMIVGAGTSDGAGAVLQYRSAGLDHWQYTGFLRRGHVPGVRGYAPQVWECPQLLRVGDRWLLVVSAQIDGSAGRVAAVAGRYDGHRLLGGEWHRLASGPAPYATSLFRDRRGDPCMISWLREDPRLAPEPSAWAGAQSLASAVGIDRTGRVIASPHPALVHGTVFTHATCAGSCVIDVTSGAPEHATVAGYGPLEIKVRRAGHRLVRVFCSGREPGVVIDRLGCPLDVLPAQVCDTIDVFVDADILEVFAGGGYGAWRLATGF